MRSGRGIGMVERGGRYATAVAEVWLRVGVGVLGWWRKGTLVRLHIYANARMKVRYRGAEGVSRGNGGRQMRGRAVSSEELNVGEWSESVGE